MFTPGRIADIIAGVMRRTLAPKIERIAKAQSAVKSYPGPHCGRPGQQGGSAPRDECAAGGHRESLPDDQRNLAELEKRIRERKNRPKPTEDDHRRATRFLREHRTGFVHEKDRSGPRSVEAVYSRSNLAKFAGISEADAEKFMRERDGFVHESDAAGVKQSEFVMTREHLAGLAAAGRAGSKRSKR
jgi:hypothetical protein